MMRIPRHEEDDKEHCACEGMTKKNNKCMRISLKDNKVGLQNSIVI